VSKAANMQIPHLINLLHREMTAWRQRIPSLVSTSDFVAGKLAEFGCEVHRNIGKTGVVGVLRRGNGRHVGCDGGPCPAKLPVRPVRKSWVLAIGPESSDSQNTSQRRANWRESQEFAQAYGLANHQGTGKNTDDRHRQCADGRNRGRKEMHYAHCPNSIGNINA
jgi:hypothetical protein